MRGSPQNVPHFPQVTVPLVGEDGNAFAILARVRAALRRAGASPDELARFMSEAMADDYGHLIDTVARWVEVV